MGDMGSNMMDPMATPNSFLIFREARTKQHVEVRQEILHKISNVFFAFYMGCSFVILFLILLLLLLLRLLLLLLLFLLLLIYIILLLEINLKASYN